MRASAVAEEAGFPTVSLVCDGFAGQAGATAGGLGISNLPVARLVGHVDAQSDAELHHHVETVTVGQVIRALTQAPDDDASEQAYTGSDIVASGSFDQVNNVFAERGWSDGLPLVPPTPERVAAFVAAAPDPAERQIGVMKSSGNAATVHNVAVNAVMAGCRPEYMPVLVAIAEVLTDPHYGAENSGDTTSAETQIILSGPAVRRLGFNHAECAFRDGYQANTSVGRFLRLYLRNVARFLPGAADKATFGHTWRVVLAEDAAAVAALNWPGFNQDQGFQADDSVITLARFTGDTVIGSIFGKDPETILAYLADGLVRQVSWDAIFIAGFAPATSRPLLVISPLVANTLARAGLSKQAVREGLFRHARMPAWQLERYLGAWTNFIPGNQTLNDMAAAGTAPPLYAESNDPDRLVPIVARADDILLLVSGDPGRSNAMAHGSNGMHGFVTSRRVRF